MRCSTGCLLAWMVGDSPHFSRRIADRDLIENRSHVYVLYVNERIVYNGFNVPTGIFPHPEVSQLGISILKCSIGSHLKTNGPDALRFWNHKHSVNLFAIVYLYNEVYALVYLASTFQLSVF